MNEPTELTPLQIVQELDQYIIGQKTAKQAVAIALRNRWRRRQIQGELRAEITPKNIMLIGPTGVGKTEVARRLAKLAQAPFIKVEATKFTEVGYVGRDVDSIVRDLMEVAINLTRKVEREKVKERALDAAEERVLDALVPPMRDFGSSFGSDKSSENSARQLFRRRLRQGELDQQEIEVEVLTNANQVEIMGPPGMEEMTEQIKSMFSNMTHHKTKQRRVRVAEALKVLAEDEANKLINDEEIKTKAIKAVEEDGIVFIDEFDKIAIQGEARGTDVSRQGVQRDLLPLVEGSSVTTKYGIVKTDHVLFIASGAFHYAKPSDLIPELQGRFPIRVELEALTVQDFAAILQSTHSSLVKQYQAMLATEAVDLQFTDDGIQAIAEIAFQVNEKTDSIGARRLYTVMEKLVEEISLNPPKGEAVYIDRSYVEEKLKALAGNQDLSRFIL